jgi:hypothetical protein
MSQIYDYPFQIGDIKFHLDPENNECNKWYHPLPSLEELKEVADNWPPETTIETALPQYKPCFSFPIIEDNLFLYKKVTSSKEFKGLFDPPYFFKILYRFFKICLDNVDRPFKDIISYLQDPILWDLDNRQIHFLFYSLHIVIKGVNGPLSRDWEPESEEESDDRISCKNKKLAILHYVIIMYYQLLEEELGIRTESPYLPNVRGIELDSSNILDKQQRLKLNQIALIHFYEKNPITRDNDQEIAERYGYFSKNSGEKLYHKYTSFSSSANRKAIPDTKLMLKNKIELFESIIQHVENKPRLLVIDEINLLKTRLKSFE